MDTRSVLKQVECYQKATNQQERDDLLYQIGISSELFTIRELDRIAKCGGQLADEQRQRVLGYIEVYFNLDLD